jgi:hypothetical protein
MNPREEYVSIPEAAEILHLKRNRVGVLCREGRFEGAVKIANNWIIPREAVLNHKPLPPGVKPRKAQLTSEKAAFLAEAEGTEGEPRKKEFRHFKCRNLPSQKEAEVRGESE